MHFVEAVRGLKCIETTGKHLFGTLATINPYNNIAKLFIHWWPLQQSINYACLRKPWN